MSCVIFLIFVCSKVIILMHLPLARVRPIFKSGNKKNLDNYRPISILPIINKIFERILSNRITKFLETSDVISQHQYGFMKGRDTQQAALHLIFDLINSVSSDGYCAGVFLDFSKAFQVLDRELLLFKLERYGIRGTLLTLLRSYLCDGRADYVGVGDATSPKLPNNFGVPQGSILGPLMFLVYANDIVSLLKSNLTLLYADDTTLRVKGRTRRLLMHRLAFTMDSVKDWANYNLLKINLNKSKIMFFHKPSRQEEEFVGRELGLGLAHKQKFLGFVVDKKLSHAAHIKHLISKLKKLKFVSYKISDFLTLSAAKSFYFGMVHSIILYGIIIWGASNKSSDYKKLCRLHFKIVSYLFISHFDCNASYKFILKRLNIMTIDDLYRMNALVALYKVLNTNYLPSMQKFIANLALKHSYNTRFRSNYRRPIPHIRSIKLNFVYNALSFWNTLPIEIRSVGSVKSFKNKVCKFIFDEYN